MYILFLKNHLFSTGFLWGKTQNFTSINSFVMTLWYTFYSFSHFTGEKNYETEIRLLAKCQMPKPTVRLRWSSLGTDVQTPHLVFCIKLRQNISYHVSPSLNSLLFQGGISPGPGQEAHQRALGHTRNVTGDFWMALQSSRIGPCYQSGPPCVCQGHFPDFSLLPIWWK